VRKKSAPEQTEAAADRAEVRAAVNTMVAPTESLAENVKLLTRAQ